MFSLQKAHGTTQSFSSLCLGLLTFQCVQTFPGTWSQFSSCPWTSGDPDSMARCLKFQCSPATSFRLVLGFYRLTFCFLWTGVGTPNGQRVLCSWVLLRCDPSDVYLIYFVSAPAFCRQLSGTEVLPDPLPPCLSRRDYLALRCDTR